MKNLYLSSITYWTLRYLKNSSYSCSVFEVTVKFSGSYPERDSRQIRLICSEADITRSWCTCMLAFHRRKVRTVAVVDKMYFQKDVATCYTLPDRRVKYLDNYTTARGISQKYYRIILFNFRTYQTTKKSQRKRIDQSGCGTKRLVALTFSSRYHTAHQTKGLLRETQGERLFL